MVGCFTLQIGIMHETSRACLSMRGFVSTLTVFLVACKVIFFLGRKIPISRMATFVRMLVLPLLSCIIVLFTSHPYFRVCVWLTTLILGELRLTANLSKWDFFLLNHHRSLVLGFRWMEAPQIWCPLVQYDFSGTFSVVSDQQLDDTWHRFRFLLIYLIMWYRPLACLLYLHYDTRQYRNSYISMIFRPRE